MTRYLTSLRCPNLGRVNVDFGGLSFSADTSRCVEHESQGPHRRFGGRKGISPNLLNGRIGVSVLLHMDLFGDSSIRLPMDA